MLHLVIGGELKALDRPEFDDLSQVHFVGAYPNYKAAYDAWKGAAQRTVDNARMRYFIIHAHRLLDPEPGSRALSTAPPASSPPVLGRLWRDYVSRYMGDVAALAPVLAIVAASGVSYGYILKFTHRRDHSAAISTPSRSARRRHRRDCDPRGAI